MQRAQGDNAVPFQHQGQRVQPLLIEPASGFSHNLHAFKKHNCCYRCSALIDRHHLHTHTHKCIRHYRARPHDRDIVCTKRKKPDTARLFKTTCCHRYIYLFICFRKKEQKQPGLDTSGFRTPQRSLPRCCPPPPSSAAAANNATNASIP